MKKNLFFRKQSINYESKADAFNQLKALTEFWFMKINQFGGALPSGLGTTADGTSCDEMSKYQRDTFTHPTNSSIF